MRGGWNSAQSCSSDGRNYAHIRMALEAYKSHLMSGKHAWIRGAVCFMAGAAALHAHRSMLEGEGAAFVGMTLQAPRFVGREHPCLLHTKLTMRIMAVRAGHSILRQSVGVRSVELSQTTDVARGALGVDFGRPRSLKS